MGSSLKSVIIPDSITNISDSAFLDCRNLTSIIIPDSVTNISNAAFSGDTKLINVVMPNSITNIGGDAFDGTGLTSITIPNSVTSFGNGVFDNCTNLTEARFLGNAPIMGIEPFVGIDEFENCSTNFKVYYLYDKTGFTNPWCGRTTEPFIGIPTSLKAVSSSYNSINISWAGVTGASGYEVYRVLSSSGTAL